ncbi:MAG TPA: 16S rRNA (adenine(1518)-N(6)/adenine(1519)-N(6))-dimethyltransferase RsmA [Thermoanaerobacterales bacterium]|nr:16S rRNA (adenine(1518)-N(6)/adenine(1519)-N(6))-dimethyltransferase RsmA [Thermoanaerobacterales bacterium]
MKDLKLTSPSVISSLIEEYDFKFSKSLGQNFLADENILRKIIDSALLNSEDMVLEIGPGIGALTFAISNIVNKVVAVEIDKSLIPILDKVLKNRDNVSVIHGDILKIDLKKLEETYFQKKPFKVVANLPYYITSPIIMTLLESNLNIDLMVFTVQKEVAQRLTALPGNKDYGAITVAINYYCQAEIITYISRNVFIPKPNVDSAVVRLIVREQPPVKLKDEALFFNLVKTVFKYRRKTLLNALSHGLEFKDKDHLENLLINVGIDPMRRGETLSIEEFAIISNRIKSV